MGRFARRFPPYQTCHRRFQQLVREGVLRNVLEALAEDLRSLGRLDPSECSIFSFVRVKQPEVKSTLNSAHFCEQTYKATLVNQDRSTTVSKLRLANFQCNP